MLPMLLGLHRLIQLWVCVWEESLDIENESVAITGGAMGVYYDFSYLCACLI